MAQIRFVVWVFCIGLLVFTAQLPLLQAQQNENLSGEWEVTSVEFGIRNAVRLQLTETGKVLNGKLYDDGERMEVKGTVNGSQVRLECKAGDQTSVYQGTFAGGALAGSFTVTGKDGTRKGTWTAKKAATGKLASERTIEYLPTDFQRQLSADVPPAMRIWPGDVVRTKSVDAGGQDEQNVQRVAGGNPLTGPFYVEGAMPGDVLAVKIRQLHINRNWAMSDSVLVGRAMTSSYAGQNKQEWKPVRWRLDANKGLATLENPPEHLKGYEVPLRPMLGCVGVAPGPWEAAIQTQDSGDLGGNLDFNRIGERATLYLQVNQPGALLYLGDAHAVQGDGELNGNALETSMDIEFSVDVIREKNIGAPRAEDPDYLMAIGLAGSLDEAFRGATSELMNWLKADYGLGEAEAAMVLGTAMEYNISEVADRNVGVVAKVRKISLESFKRKP